MSPEFVEFAADSQAKFYKLSLAFAAIKAAKDSGEWPTEEVFLGHNTDGDWLHSSTRTIFRKISEKN